MRNKPKTESRSVTRAGPASPRRQQPVFRELLDALAGHGRRVGHATVVGQLAEVATYPGVVEDPPAEFE